MALVWHGLAAGFGLALLIAPGTAAAAVYSYVDWTAANVAQGTASGTITLPDDSKVEVAFAAINQNGSAGSLYGAQINGGANYWSPNAPYLSAEVENAPPTPDILQLQGGQNQTYQVTLSEAIKDPIMAIVSLGQAGLRTTYDFDAPFAIVSQGAGYWGGSATALSALAGDILEGYEGHGTIRFVGSFSTFSWTVPTPEGWHGFTFGIRTTERLEPTPGAGGAGGETAAAGNSNGGSNAAAGGDGNGDGDGGTASSAGAAAGGAGDETGSGGDPSAAGSPGSSGAKSDGGTPSVPVMESGAAGEPEDERAHTEDDAGCNCSVARGSLELPALSAASLLLASLVRRSRRRR